MKQVKLLLLLLTLFFSITHQQEDASHGQFYPKTFNPDKDPIDKLVLDHLNEKIFDQDNSNLQYLSVLECHVQIVSGQNYHLKLDLINKDANQQEQYRAFIHVITWKDLVQIEEFEKIEKDDPQQPVMNDIQLQHAIQLYIEKQIHEKFKDSNQLQIALYTNVIDFRIVEKQVVEGMKYTCKILLGSPYMDYKNKAGKVESFLVTITHQAWVNKFNLLDIQPYEYTEEDFQEHILLEKNNLQESGGWHNYELLEEDSQLMSTLETALNTHLEKLNLNKNYRILSIQNQIVSGQNIKIHIANQEDDWEYEAVIFNQPWNNLTYITSFEKISSSIPTKSSIRAHAGGWTQIQFEEDEDIAQYLVKQALNQYFVNKGIDSQDYQIINVKKQVVAGIKYNIILKMQNKNFNAIIVIQPWKDYSEILSFNEIDQYSHTDL